MAVMWHHVSRETHEQHTESIGPNPLILLDKTRDGQKSSRLLQVYMW